MKKRKNNDREKSEENDLGRKIFLSTQKRYSAHWRHPLNEPPCICKSVNVPPLTSRVFLS